MISLKNTLKAISSKFSALNTLLNDVPHYTLLWTNPDPRGYFYAQTISLDLSKYDAVEILFKQDNNQSTTMTQKTLVGKDSKLMTYGGENYPVEINARKLSTSSTGVYFYNGFRTSLGSTSGSQSSGHCVPYQIYGIKFGGGYKVLRSLFAKEVAVC